MHISMKAHEAEDVLDILTEAEERGVEVPKEFKRGLREHVAEVFEYAMPHVGQAVLAGHIPKGVGKQLLVAGQALGYMPYSGLNQITKLVEYLKHSGHCDVAPGVIDALQTYIEMCQAERDRADDEDMPAQVHRTVAVANALDRDMPPLACPGPQVAD